MRDRADLAQAHFAVGTDVRLAARDAAPCRVEQSETEGGHRPRIGAAGKMLALMFLDRAVEIEAEVGAVVEGVRRCGEVASAGRSSAIRESVAKASSGVAKNRYPSPPWKLTSGSRRIPARAKRCVPKEIGATRCDP